MSSLQAATPFSRVANVSAVGTVSVKTQKVRGVVDAYVPCGCVFVVPYFG